MLKIKGARWMALLVILSLPFSLAARSGGQAAAQEKPGYEPATIAEELLFEVPTAAEALGMSPDGKQIVWKVKKGKSWVMTVNGEPGPEFDAIFNEYAFSPDSRRFAYVASRGKTCQVILDGKEFGKLHAAYTPGGAPQQLMFSSDSQHFAYLAGAMKTYRVVLDGQEQGPACQLGAMSDLVLSPDGKRWAYWAKKSGLHDFVMVTEEGLTEHEAISGVDNKFLYGSYPRFSPDGKRLAFVAARSKGGLRKHKEYMVLDGQEVREFDIGVSNPVFSPDSRRFAYTAVDAELTAGKAAVIVDGKTGPGFEAIVTLPAFSPDSQHVAYIAINKGRYSVQVIDDQVTVADMTYGYKGGLAAGYGGLTYSPNGLQLAYIVDWTGVDRAPRLYGMGWVDGRVSRVNPDNSPSVFLFLDAKQYGIGFDDIGRRVFSPESRFLAFPVKRDKKWSMIVNGKEGKPYDLIWGKTLVFSADEKEVTYIAEEAKKLFRVTQTVY